MRILFAVMPILSLAITTAGIAQDPGPRPAAVGGQVVTPVVGDQVTNQPSGVLPTPAIPPMVTPWNSSRDYQSYDSPRMAVHRNAAWRAAQRRQRIASRRWMGYSPLRPPTSATPWMGTYQSGWNGVGVLYTLPGSFYQPALPTVIIGQSPASPIR